MVASAPTVARLPGPPATAAMVDFLRRSCQAAGLDPDAGPLRRFGVPLADVTRPEARALNAVLVWQAGSPYPDRRPWPDPPLIELLPPAMRAAWVATVRECELAGWPTQRAEAFATWRAADGPADEFAAWYAARPVTLLYTNARAREATAPANSA